MKDISELMEQLMRLLEQQSAVAMTSNRPYHPTAIVYAGMKSWEAKKDIEQTLRSVWRARADAICHFLQKDGAYSVPNQSGSFWNLSEREALDAIDDMFGKDDCFKALGDLFLCLVQNTAEYTSLEEFRRDYMGLDVFGEETDYNLKTMKLVLLDESSRGKALAEEIRTYLSEQMTNEDPACRTTVILSNRMSGGALLKNRMLQENFVLAANIILIANGMNQTFSPMHATLFPVTNRSYITAAYARVTKPNRAICEVMVNTLLNWLATSFNKGTTLSVNDINTKLGIAGGTMELMTSCFKKYMVSGIPGREILECLPRSTASLEPVGGLPFNVFNSTTMNSFDLFFRQNVVSACEAEASIHQFRRDFKNHIQREFSHKEAATSLTPQIIDSILKGINTAAPAETLPAYTYMVSLVETQYCRTMIAVCRDVLMEMSEASRSYIRQINNLVDDFNLNYMMDIDATVEGYYAPLTTQFLNREVGMELTNRLNGATLSDEAILDAIYDSLAMIISSHPIFAMPLAEEMTQRMGGNVNTMHVTVKQMLTGDLSEKVRIRAAINPNRFTEIMMLDTKCDVFNFLENIFPGMEHMNTSNSNAIELVQFYNVAATIL